MREKSRQENLKRLRRLEDAKKKLRDSAPEHFDIDNEIRMINSKLSPPINHPVQNATPLNNVSEEEQNDDPDPQRNNVQGEPFGQDLNTFDNNDQNRNIIENIPKNEPEKSSVQNSDPQAKASEAPTPPPKSPKEEATPKKPPGGLAARARNLFRRGSNVNKTKTAAEEQSGTQRTTELAKNKLADRANQAIRKWAAKRWAAILATSPTTWIIIGVGIIIAIILFIVALSYMGTLSGKKPSTSGGTQLQPVNFKTDSNALQTFLKLTGDKTVTEQAINDTTSAIKKNLLETKDLEAVKANPALVKQIDTALGSLAIFEGNKSQESAKVFLSDLGKVYDITEADIPPFPTGNGYSTKAPVNPMTTQFNSTLHGGTFLWPEKISGHGTYTGNNQGICDAVDVSAIKNNSVTSVTPIFGGTVVDVSSDGHDGTKVTVKNGDYQILYAHLVAVDKKIGDKVSINDTIGAIKTNHVQIEVIYKDRCLVTTHADMIDHASLSRRHQDWGAYLWDRIVKTFNLK